MGQCLKSLADSRLLVDCLNGQCGEMAQDVVKADVWRVLREAEQSLDDLVVELSGTVEHKQLIITGGPLFDAYDYSLLNSVGHLLPETDFFDGYRRLLSTTALSRVPFAPG